MTRGCDCTEPRGAMQQDCSATVDLEEGAAGESRELQTRRERITSVLVRAALNVNSWDLPRSPAAGEGGAEGEAGGEAPVDPRGPVRPIVINPDGLTRRINKAIV